MLHKYLLRNERAKLLELERQRARTSEIINAEQVALKQEVFRSLGTGKGLLLIFAAGCATGLTVRHGAKVGKLRHFPLSQALALISLFGQFRGVE